MTSRDLNAWRSLLRTCCRQCQMKPLGRRGDVMRTNPVRAQESYRGSLRKDQPDVLTSRRAEAQESLPSPNGGRGAGQVHVMRHVGHTFNDVEANVAAAFTAGWARFAAN